MLEGTVDRLRRIFGYKIDQETGNDHTDPVPEIQKGGILEVGDHPGVIVGEPKLIGIEIGDIPLAFDENSPTWKYIEAICLERLAALRRKNDNLLLTEKETAYTRGRIDDVKWLLDIPKQQLAAKNRAHNSPPVMPGPGE